VISLGETPLANALLTAEQTGSEEPRVPLNVTFCTSCTLIQLTENVAPERMFSEYLYLSSFSDTMLAHAKALVDRLVAERGLDSSHQVIEIASNDGYLLQYYQQQGIPVLGIEPAANIAEIAVREKGIETLVEFFGRELGEKLAADGRQADVVHANNVFAHVPDPGDFAAGLASLLRPKAVAVIEAPYIRDLIDGCEFDTIYHEHFSYFSLTAVERLLRGHGLAVIDVEHLPIHGGSLRYFVAHADQQASARVSEWLAEEQAWGVQEPEFYRGFARRVEALKGELTGLLRRLKADGCSLAAYGASAKGATLLNSFGIGAELLDFVADRSTAKQGLFTPGTQLEILPAEALLERQPDYVLLLTWNFADEILKQQAHYRKRGGKFIVPVPNVRVV
jgi:SAM-dependent methyltransferase